MPTEPLDPTPTETEQAMDTDVPDDRYESDDAENLEAADPPETEEPPPLLLPVPVAGTDVQDADDDLYTTGIWDPGITQPRRSISRGEDMPVPPQWVLDAARQAPGNWLYLPDPNWEGEGIPPPGPYSAAGAATPTARS